MEICHKHRLFNENHFVVLVFVIRTHTVKQWHSQRLCVEADPSARGARVEAPSGMGSGEGCPSPPHPTRRSGEAS